MRKPIWILDSILPVNVCGASAVLEIIDSDLPIEVVVNAAKIDPEMRHLMDEKRSSVQILGIVDFLPFKRRNPLFVTLRLDGKRRGSQGKRIKDDGFAVTLVPPVRKKPRLGFPTVGNRRPFIEGPLPIHAAKEFRQVSAVSLLATRRSEVAGCT